jgi:hypothetical protein
VRVAHGHHHLAGIAVHSDRFSTDHQILLALQLVLYKLLVNDRQDGCHVNFLLLVRLGDHLCLDLGQLGYAPDLLLLLDLFRLLLLFDLLLRPGVTFHA